MLIRRCFPLVLAACAVACGGVVTNEEGASASGSSSSGSTSSTSSTSSSSSGAGGAAMCNLPPPPSPTLPNTKGCYENDHNTGWFEVPCGCALWLWNTEPTTISAAVDLHVEPADVTPTFGGAVQADVAFEDPNASAFAVWSKQTGNGTIFSVVHDHGVTTVYLATTELSLAPIPVDACTTIRAQAQTTLDPKHKLALHAVLDGGKLAPFANTCSNPPPTDPGGPTH